MKYAQYIFSYRKIQMLHISSVTLQTQILKYNTHVIKISVEY